MTEGAPSALGTGLLEVLDQDQIIVDPDVLQSFRYDLATLTPAGQPLAAVRARSVDDVVATLRWAKTFGVPVVTRGAGTGLSGGANAVDGCIVLSTAAMDKILAIDPTARTARVECGVLNGDLAAAVAELGLWYPPDPASRAISTIGGNIATNAGGSCCLKYGVTGDHVAELTAVLADGTVIHTGATTRKNVAGLDLTRLLTGSEGTLAVIVEATLRLRPASAPPATVVSFLPTLEAAGGALLTVEGIGQPSLLEFMDRTTIRAVESLTKMGLDTDAGALLLLQFDGPAAATEASQCAAALEAGGASYTAQTSDPNEGEMLLAARRSALPALERLGSTLLDDVAVPKPSIPALIARIEAIATSHSVLVGTFGHAGDGNLHPTLVYDPDSTQSKTAVLAAFDEIIRAALDLGGTITGEHGVGTLKQPYLTTMVGSAERALMGRIKAAFDPTGVLNPGKAI